MVWAGRTGVGILPNTQVLELTWNWLENNDGPCKGFKLVTQEWGALSIRLQKTDWISVHLYRSSTLCLFEQPSEKGSGCCKSCCSMAVSQKTALPHEKGACCLFIYHKEMHL